MSMRIEVEELQRRLPDVIQRLRNEELVVLQDGVPVAKLVPSEPSPPAGGFDRPPPGAARGKFVCTADLLEPMPEDELKMWYSTEGF